MMQVKKQLSLLSNLPGLQSTEKVCLMHELIGPSPAGRRAWLQRFALVWRARKFDAVLINCNTAEVIALALLMRFVPFNRCKLIASDPVFMTPRGCKQRVLAYFKKVLLQRVDLFILIQKDFRGYQRFFGVTPQRSAYVPWKVNALDVIQRLNPVEGDYLFSSGATLRDWDTLAQAMRGVDLPLVISLPNAECARNWGLNVTHLPDLSKFPAGTRIERNSSNPEEWLSLAAKAKFVVFPIIAQVINASGISTALSCMALRKCVIISASPATRGILDGGQCLVVPPGDAQALGQAMIEANRDPLLRQRTAETGYRYALQCGDSRRLYRDFIDQIAAAGICR